jgi:hypothetical protein
VLLVVAVLARDPMFALDVDLVLQRNALVPAFAFFLFPARA